MTKREELLQFIHKYEKEINLVTPLICVWHKLSETAQEAFEKDFDDAIVAREIVLEELLKSKRSNVLKEDIKKIDKQMQICSDAVRHLYSFDVKSYLGEQE